MAQALATLNVDLNTMHIMGDLQGGIEEAERLLSAVSPYGHMDQR